MNKKYKNKTGQTESFFSFACVTQMWIIKVSINFLVKYAARGNEKK